MSTETIPTVRATLVRELALHGVAVDRAEQLTDAVASEAARDAVRRLPVHDIADIAERFRLLPVTGRDGIVLPAIQLTRTGYTIRVARESRTGGVSAFQTDFEGVILRAPQGYNGEYKPGRIVGLAEAADRLAAEAGRAALGTDGAHWPIDDADQVGTCPGCGGTGLPLKVTAETGRRECRPCWDRDVLGPRPELADGAS